MASEGYRVHVLVSYNSFRIIPSRGVARIFSEVRKIFQISLPPPQTPNLTGKSICIDVIMLSFVYCKDRPWVEITCSRFIPSRLPSARIFKFII